MTRIDPERERQRLVQRYSAMSDLELQKAGRNPAALTEIAFAALQQEMDQRGLEWPGKGISWASLHPAIPIVSSVPAEEKSGAELSQALTSDSEHPDGGPMVVRRYRDMPEAFVARAALESAGIGCYLFDEVVIGMDWFWSNALGNLRLVVRRGEADEAKKILDEETPEKFDVEGIGEYEQPRCPLCGSLDVSGEELIKKIAFPALLFLGLPILINEKGWHCHACDHRWGREGNGGSGQEG